METQSVSSPAKPPVKARSALQREASRRNGSRSKGPKTPEGKARSSRNARLHALGVPAIADPAFHQQVTEFALALAGPDADPTALALATVMAAAQIDVQRARLAACAVMSGMKADSSTTYSKAVRRLAWIKRYEHRCALCRDQAMRQLREWRLALAGQTTADAHQSADGRFAVASMAAEQQYARAATACEPMRSFTRTTRAQAKTNLTAEKSAPVIASRLASRCSRAEGRMKKRTRAIPLSQRAVARSRQIKRPGIHFYKTNPSRHARARPGRGGYIRQWSQAPPGGCRSRASGLNIAGYKTYTAPASSARSAALIAAGVPTCIQRPSSRNPNSRPAAAQRSNRGDMEHGAGGGLARNAGVRMAAPA
jgi:hypothetical protein